MQITKRKKCLSMVLTLAMLITLLPAVTMPASAAQTTIGFTEGIIGEDKDYSNADPFIRTIDGATFTFSPGSTAYPADPNGFDIHTDGTSSLTGIYALSTRAGNTGVDFTVSVQPGCTFDLTGFTYTSSSSNIAVYYNGMVSNITYTGDANTLITKTDLIQFNNITSVTFTSEDYALFQNLVIDDVKPIVLTVTDANISISGASGTNGAYKIGDTMTATWNNTANGDDNNTTVTGVTVDFSQFGAGAAVPATNSSGTWTATYMIEAGLIDTTNKNISITATDSALNTTTTADTSNATVDNVAPTVTDAKITISVGGGTGGAFIVDDTVTATWNNTVGGDNNSDTISAVTMNFTQFGGEAAVAATNSSGTWTATYDVTAGTIQETLRNVSVTATDNAGNMTTKTDTTNATVDNAAPSVSSITLNGSPSADSTSVTFGITFNETVNQVSTDDFSLATTGTAMGSITSVSVASGSVIDVTVSEVSGSGSIRIDLNSGTNIADAAGNTPPAAYSAGATHTVLVPTAPGAPTAVSALAGDAQAQVSFTAPVSNGGAIITSYTVTANPGGSTAVGAGSPIMVSGLTNGTAYTFTVTATNSAGTSTPSAASNSVTPKGDQTITFNNPGQQNFGTTPTLTATSDSGLTPTFTSTTPGVCTITSGGSLTFISAGSATIIASQAGNGSYLPAASVSQTFTVNAVVPGAPTAATATAGDTQASVSFTAPASTGGTSITGYTVTVSPADVAPVNGAASPITVTGLTNGQAYTFTVTAANIAGTGPASTASNSITPAASQTITFVNPGAQNFGTTPTLTATSDSGLTPTFTTTTPGVCTITSGGILTFISAGSATITASQAGDGSYLPAVSVTQTFTVNAVVPGAPTAVTATAGDTQATVSFTAPASTGGTSITGYTVTVNPADVAPVNGATSPITVTGLTNGQAYTFTVTATNSAGTGIASFASNSITPAASQTITFANPGAQNFGTSPTLTATSDSGLTPTFTSTTPGVCTITSGGSLTFISAGSATIIASQAGNGSYLPAASVSQTFTVNAIVPGAPTAATATAGDTQASVSFTAPASTGGTAITGYTVTVSPADVAPVNGAASPITVTGLTNGQAYTFTVTATNSAGTGITSFASNSITPAASTAGGTSGTSAQTYNADVVAGDGGSPSLPITVDRNSGKASVEVSAQSGLLSDGKSIVITMPSIPNVNAYSIGIPIPDLSTADTQGSLTVATPKGSITVPTNMLAGLDNVDGSKAQITIGEGDKTNLPAEVKATIGDRPLIQLTFSIDGKQTEWNNPAAAVTVTIPYTPTVEELANPESIVVWYIDSSGNIVTIPNGRYNTVTGMVTFNTTHFSEYAVAFNKIAFSDVADTAWYSDAVSFIAAREITTGTGGGKYSPEAKLTRGEFIALMLRAYGISPDTNPTGNFSDAGNTYYTGYLATAKRLGITSGVGDNMYAPSNEITRQEMFTLLFNTLNVIGRLPEGETGKTLSDFPDAGQIDLWAIDAMALLVKSGTVSGSDGVLTPTGTTTRAEMAQVLFNLTAK